MGLKSSWKFLRLKGLKLKAAGRASEANWRPCRVGGMERGRKKKKLRW